MAEQQPEAMTEEQVSAWVREHFQAANKYLAEQGIISDQILSKDSRYLAPYVAVWKFNTQDKKTLWVINGDVSIKYKQRFVAAARLILLRYHIDDTSINEVAT